MQIKTVEQAANEAVFIMQMNSYAATRYIMNKAGVSEAAAQKALTATVTFHKQARCAKASA